MLPRDRSARALPLLGPAGEARAATSLHSESERRRTGYLFESNRLKPYTTRYVQRLVHEAAQRAGIAKRVTPHRLRASVATILLDAGISLGDRLVFHALGRLAIRLQFAPGSARVRIRLVRRIHGK